MQCEAKRPATYELRFSLISTAAGLSQSRFRIRFPPRCDSWYSSLKLALLQDHRGSKHLTGTQPRYFTMLQHFRNFVDGHQDWHSLQPHQFYVNAVNRRQERQYKYQSPIFCSYPAVHRGLIPIPIPKAQHLLSQSTLSLSPTCLGPEAPL